MTNAITPADERQLALMERAMVALAEAQTLEEVIEFRDRTTAFKHYTRKKGKASAMHQRANEMLLWSERRLGELSRELEKGKRGPRPSGGDSPQTGGKTPPSKAEALAAAGIETQEASRFERMAAIPEDRFEEEVRKPAATTRTLARIGAEYRRTGKPPRRSAPVPVPGPAVSDRILEQRALMFRVAVEKVLRTYLARWPSDASTAPLARVLVEVSNNVKELQS